MINSREAAGVVQKRILDNCLVKDEEKLLVGEVFFVRPVFSFCSGFSVLRFFLAYGVLCHFLRTLFWGKICKVSARGQTVSYAFSPHGEKTPVLVRGWSWYRDFRLRRSRKKYNGLPVLFPWQRLRIEAFAHFALSQYGLAPAFLSYSTKTGMFLREYPKGITLEYVAKEGIWKNLNGEDKEKLLLSIVRAIENMHSLGIVHGDLAPGNILFPDKSFENVFFIDFENAWFSRKNVEYISSEQMYSEEWKRMLERAEVLDKDLFLKMRVFLERENLV